MSALRAAKLAVDSRPGGMVFSPPCGGPLGCVPPRVLRKSEKGNGRKPRGWRGVSSNLARPIEQPC